MNLMPVSLFRKQLSTDFLRTLKENPLTLLSHSRPVAVVVDYQEYEAMQAELMRLRAKQMQDVAATMQQTLRTRRSGETTDFKTLDEVAEDFNLERSSTS